VAGPQLKQPVGIRAVRFEGWAELLRETPTKARLYLNGPTKDDIIGVVALIDLNGPTIYPSKKMSAGDRYDWAKNDIEGRVSHPKFRQFFAVHETEAWLLSNPDLFPAGIKDSLPPKAGQPEAINFSEPPAKLLENLYKNKFKRTYKKVTDGGDLFRRLDPDIAYLKCPKLKELLDEMLEMARAAGL
jgi:hypothetical protein